MTTRSSFFSGVVNAIQGRRQEKLGADQAQHVTDALRRQWAGPIEETTDRILRQWGEWADDPVALAAGVTALAPGKLTRYAGATGVPIGRNAR